MTDIEARLATLEAHWTHADRQMTRQSKALEDIAKALAVLTTRVEGIPRKVELNTLHDAEDRAVAVERERVHDNLRQVVGIAVSIGSAVGAIVFGVLSLVLGS